MRTHIVAYGLKRAARDEPLFDYIVCEGVERAQKLYADLVNNAALHSASICVIVESTDYEGMPQSNPITAMCLWEAWLEMVRAGRRHHGELGGAVEARELMATLAPACDASWAIAAEKYQYDDAFDWDWCPSWLAIALSTAPGVKLSANQYVAHAHQGAEDFARSIAENAR